MTNSPDPERPAFDAFVAARYQALLRAAYVITGNVHDGTDLLHDALARVYARRSLIRDAAATEAYVRRAMVRAHISRWRRLGRETPTAQPPEFAAPEPAEWDPQLGAAMRRLPPRQRTAVALRYYADLPVAQVADEMGCSLATAKTHLARAMKALRQDLAQDRQDREAITVGG
ncbi:SigE family RNA polymerase sigma factor [Kitasatospora cinereorecta]|uniref:SigE family RNA polymerase sigma factor n=1 Tax=Kitasatospora cinereorecta TaxID=285560 RepID=A0ABW0VIA1_9ACTN